MEIFSQRELALFGANGRPLLPIAPKTRIELMIEDRRTEEEKERALQREIQKRTYPIPGIGETILEQLANEENGVEQGGG